MRTGWDSDTQGQQQRGGGVTGPSPSLTDDAWLLAFSAAASTNRLAGQWQHGCQPPFVVPVFSRLILPAIGPLNYLFCCLFKDTWPASDRVSSSTE